MKNRQTLLQRITRARIFNKFDLKSGFWQVRIAEKDRYKTKKNKEREKEEEKRRDDDFENRIRVKSIFSLNTNYFY